MNQIRILIAEDDLNFRETLELEYQEKGYDVTSVGSLKEFEQLKDKLFHQAVLDLKLGTDSGLQLLAKLQEHCPEVRAIILTGYGSFATAVRAIKMGAVNYLPKPAMFRDIEAAFGAMKSRSVNDLSPADIAEAPSLARHEREYIEYILNLCGGNISHAARQLGIHRQSLQRKLRKYTPRI